MTLYKNKYRIESARLKGWDYSSDGYYFVTICTKNMRDLFGEIVNGKMILNEYGNIVKQCWFDLINHYHNLWLDELMIMPNHFHGIMVIDNTNSGVSASPGESLPGVSVSPGESSPILSVQTGLKPVSTKQQHGLFEFVRALKTFSSRGINELRHSPGTSIWQSRFHDRIIRDGDELNRIREYIINNPQNWIKDNNYIMAEETQ